MTTSAIRKSIPFSWSTLTAGATTLTLGDDELQGPFSLGFTFTFYGTDYTQIWVSSNGAIGFTSNYLDYLDFIPTNNKAILGLQQDLDPSSGGTVKYELLSNVFVVQWENVPQYGKTNQISFQIKLFTDSSIEVHTLTATNTANQPVTQGIEFSTTVYDVDPNRNGMNFSLTRDGQKWFSRWYRENKPTTNNYTKISNPVNTSINYDDSKLIYDDSTTTYDQITNQNYTNIPKPTSSTYTLISKPT